MRALTAMTVWVLIFTAIAGQALGAEDSAGWRQIAPQADADHPQRSPSCSGGPVLAWTDSGAIWAEADTRFSFFLRDGDPNRLLIIWDGGGACWDFNSCIGAGMRLTPIYDMRVDETPESLAAFGGIADRDDPRNPVRDYTQVFIPYCTGDLHYGSRDTTYDLPFGGQWTIRHRGQLNVMAVLDALRSRYDALGTEPAEIVLVGVSAGGYGVLHNYPAVTRTFPTTEKISVLVDSANGVMTEQLYATALEPDGAWGVWSNLDESLQNAYASGPETLLTQTFQDLAWEHPQTRFGQYTRVTDGTQILFYNLARHMDDPWTWFDLSEVILAGLDWTQKAQNTMWDIAATTGNYRLYLGAGTEHTILGEASFYEERSGGGVLFSDWFSDMLTQPLDAWSRWQNLSCAPACLVSGWPF
ncbi:pectin acetylesterase-family hydrolase [Thiocystis violacea]|uniref:pectin acetylesterase-family hydrolase n=1 Tax=Thiocystis violacea TaxID=13725 RepID=UPI0019056E85|nr:pectin acetylesterase-family hydrolase [Thiocystis violacea]